MEIGVSAKAKDRLRSQGCLVSLLDAITEPHQWQEVAVDLAQQLLVLLFGVVGFLDDVSIVVDDVARIDIRDRASLLVYRRLLECRLVVGLQRRWLLLSSKVVVHARAGSK
jgi:hypothetical protein